MVNAKAVAVFVGASVLCACQSTEQVIKDTLVILQGSSNSVSPENISERFDINPGLAVADPLLGAYITSLLSILSAQEIWLTALGKAELAAQLEAQREDLERGSTLDSEALDTINALSEKAQDVIAETKDKEETLSRENSVLFATGFVPYYVGVKQAREVVQVAPGYSQYLIDNAADYRQLEQNKIRLNAVTEITRSGPNYMTTLYETTALVYEYSQDQGIEMPSEMEELNDISQMSL
ncbi:hypothetical protein [Alteromonas sp. C1M14]|uniref:hypothetical protein n=1 Tax=Alteromonas sp. C1M14 TaxID=2841567 RepID=UPI001C08A2F4|nr:hypothetical protein [Alteromonas sp. C1M14]MBU2978222.1 hypothetical protein [Alteromonas sp. C1M14]